MLQAQKTEIVAQLKDRFDRMASAVFLDFKGMTVEEVSQLRDVCRDKGVEYRVVKNTLVRQALRGEAYVERLDSALKGMTGVAWSFEEPAAAAKLLKDFCKENEKLKIKAGLVEGQVLDAKGVEEQLATMPGKDEMRAQLLALLSTPAQNLVRLLNTPAEQMVRVLNAPGQDFVGVLEAKRRKDEGG